MRKLGKTIFYQSKFSLEEYHQFKGVCLKGEALLPKEVRKEIRRRISALESNGKQFRK